MKPVAPVTKTPLPVETLPGLLADAVNACDAVVTADLRTDVTVELLLAELLVVRVEVLFPGAVLRVRWLMLLL